MNVKTWSWLRLLASLAAFVGVYILTQLVTLVAVGVWDAWSQPQFDIGSWMDGIESNGFALSVVTCASAIVCVPFIRVLVGLAEVRPWDFLGFRPKPARDMLVSCGVLVLFVIVSDLMTAGLGRPVVPTFATDAYATARYPALLFVSLVLAAPLLEELFFRGFLVGALTAIGVGTATVVAMTTVSFAILHTQYDLYGMAMAFLTGLLLIGARLRFDSIVPSLAMHGLSNAIAFVETIVLSRLDI